MQLTTEQADILRAYILADPVLSQKPHSSDGAYDIALALNNTYTPDFYVWKTSVSQDEIMQNGFDWTQVDNLSVGKSRIWEWMFANSSRTINPTKVNIRAGIDAAWVGTAAMLAVRAVIYTHLYRKASILEKLLATGTGTTASPATLSIEGGLSYPEIQSIMGW
jgi:hypothetical protein